MVDVYLTIPVFRNQILELIARISLGGAFAPIVWLYWTGFVIMIDARFNPELLETAQGDWQLKDPEILSDRVMEETWKATNGP